MCPQSLLKILSFSLLVLPTFEAFSKDFRSAEEVTAFLLQTNPIVLKFRKSFGTLKAGELYLYRHDDLSRKDVVSSLQSHRHIHAYTNESLSKKKLSLWGAPFEIIDSAEGPCIADPTNPRQCAADILGPLAQESLQKKISNAVANARSHLENDIRILDTEDFPTCPTNTSLKLSHVSFRNTSVHVYDAVQILPFVHKSREEYLSLADKIDSAVEKLQKKFHNSFSRTTYSQCYGDLEFQTARLVVRGLYSLYRRNNSKQIKDYIIRVWKDVVASGQIKNLGQNILARKFESAAPNAFGQYLEFASIAQRLGVDALQGSFTAFGIEALFEAQALTLQRSKCEAYPQMYGGWYHSKPGDCSQKMGYHSFIIDGLSSLHSYLRDSRLCTHSYWMRACQNIPFNLLAAAAWIHNLQRPDGSILDIAPDSGPGISPSHWGTPTAVAVGYRLMTQYSEYFSPSSTLKTQYDGTLRPAREITQGFRRALDYSTVTLDASIGVAEALRWDLKSRGISLPD